MHMSVHGLLVMSGPLRLDRDLLHFRSSEGREWGVGSVVVGSEILAQNICKSFKARAWGLWAENRGKTESPSGNKPCVWLTQ